MHKEPVPNSLGNLFHVHSLYVGPKDISFEQEKKNTVLMGHNCRIHDGRVMCDLCIPSTELLPYGGRAGLDQPFSPALLHFNPPALCTAHLQAASRWNTSLGWREIPSSSLTHPLCASLYELLGDTLSLCVVGMADSTCWREGRPGPSQGSSDDKQCLETQVSQTFQKRLLIL